MRPDHIEEIKHNLFHGSHGAVRDWDAFPWHQGGGVIHTTKPHSSQALAIDFFGTVMCSADRTELLNAIADSLGLPSSKTRDLALEWQDPANLLNEPRPTQVDAAALGSDSLILFECKFTETGGACSQTAKRDGLRQCTGNYETQNNPVNKVTNRCALSGKDI